MKVEIRRVEAGDEALFEHVAEAVFDEPIDPARLRAYLADSGHHMLVAIHEGEIVGQAAGVVHRHPDKATEFYIDEVGVSPKFHRRGIARRMLDEMFALAKDLGCEEIWVGTEPDNIPARALYASRDSTAEAFVMYVFKI